MSFLGQTLHNPLSRPSGEDHTTGPQHWRWLALVVLVVALVVAGDWAWTHFRSTTTVTTESIAPVVVNTTQHHTTSTTTAAPQPVAQPQPVVEKAPLSAPEQQPAAAAMTTTQTTQGLVVIAGTDGATLLTAPDGEKIAVLDVGALLNATGRSADGAWVYVNTTEGVVGWVAVAQIVAFGTEKLPIVTVTAPLPATVAETAQPTKTASAVVTETATSSTTAEVATAAVVTATNSTSPTVTESDAEANVADASVTGTVTAAGLNIRSGPGMRYGIVDKASRNETLTILARDEAANWVQIALPENEDGFGWVAASYVRLSGDIAALPVSDEVSAAPTAATTTAASSATTASPATGTTTTAATVTAAATTQPAATQTTAAVSASPATGLSGTLVFQTSPGGTIYAYNLSTGRLWQLTSGFDPAISPDGQTVAFVRTAGENGIYLINIDGSNERLIFSGRNTLASPKWSPDGNYIVFSRGDEYKECRDVGRGMCLTDKELLAQNPNIDVSQFPLIKQYESNLARVDKSGDNYRDIANLESARAADWNEAGIVYQSTAGLQITADTPDATSTLVTHDPYKPAYEDPDWQPNGGKIVFVSRSGNHREIYTVNPDGSGMVALTAPVTTLVDELPNNMAPAWSPDGQYIVFLSNRGDDNSAGAWRLWVMNADGSNQHPLPINVTINYTYGNEQAVSWGR